MFEKLCEVLLIVFWLICIPLDIGSAIEHYKIGRYHRCGACIMFAILGFMFIAKHLFVS